MSLVGELGGAIGGFLFGGLIAGAAMSAIGVWGLPVGLFAGYGFWSATSGRGGGGAAAGGLS